MAPVALVVTDCARRDVLCRACCARRDVLCRACCTARVTQHVVYYFFLYQNACELDSES